MRLSKHTDLHIATLILIGALSFQGCALRGERRDLDNAEITPYHHDGYRPARIEQFSDEGKLVYRWCHGDECPQLTPKIVRSPLPVLPAVTPVAVPAPVTESAVVTAKQLPQMIRHLIAEVLPAAVVPSSIPPVFVNPTPVPSSSRPVQDTELPTRAPLKMDPQFDSMTALAQFASGVETLGPQSRQKIADLAPAARQAARIELKGHAGRLLLTEELRKLAVGRSVAVRNELVKYGVQKEKIRIKPPASNDLVNPAHLDAPENRSVVIRLLNPQDLAEKETAR